MQAFAGRTQNPSSSCGPNDFSCKPHRVPPVTGEAVSGKSPVRKSAEGPQCGFSEFRWYHGQNPVRPKPFETGLGRFLSLAYPSSGKAMRLYKTTGREKGIEEL